MFQPKDGPRSSLNKYAFLLYFVSGAYRFTHGEIIPTFIENISLGSLITSLEIYHHSTKYHHIK